MSMLWGFPLSVLADSRWGVGVHSLGGFSRCCLFGITHKMKAHACICLCDVWSRICGGTGLSGVPEICARSADVRQMCARSVSDLHICARSYVSLAGFADLRQICRSAPDLQICARSHVSLVWRSEDLRQIGRPAPDLQICACMAFLRSATVADLRQICRPVRDLMYRLYGVPKTCARSRLSFVWRSQDLR